MNYTISVRRVGRDVHIQFNSLSLLFSANLDGTVKVNVEFGFGGNAITLTSQACETILSELDNALAEARAVAKRKSIATKKRKGRVK